MHCIDLLDAIEFHDVIIYDMVIKIRRESYIKFIFELYIGNSATRERWEIKFYGVDNLTINIDVMELFDNATAGNISHGYVKQNKINGGYKFFIYFTDGMINFNFKEVSIVNNASSSGMTGATRSDGDTVG